MKNRDEFKKSIYNKLEHYYIEKNKKRRRIINVLAPACICLILACGVTLLLYLDKFNNDSTLILPSPTTAPVITNSPDNQSVLYKSVIVMSNILDESNDDSVRTYVTPDKMQAIVDTIEKLNYTQVSDGIDESESILSISINYLDGKSVTYYIKESLIKKDDGGWFLIPAHEITELIDLINSFETDK